MIRGLTRYPSPAPRFNGASALWPRQRSGGLLVLDLERCLLRGRSEAAFDPALQTRHERDISEPLPALPRIVNRHDRPAFLRRAGGVEDLALRQVPAAVRVYRRERCFVLLLRFPYEPMYDAVCHLRSFPSAGSRAASPARKCCILPLLAIRSSIASEPTT